MAANPYQHPQGIDEAIPAQTRTSALAVCSLVFGIICCIPGSGLLATILGGAGLIRISQSEGKLSGRAMAVIGLLLGLLSTAFWIAGAATSMYVLNQAQAFVQPLKSLQAGDVAGARAALAPSASAKLTDEQAKAFFDELKAELGAYQGAPQGLAGWINDYGAVGPILEKANMNSTSGAPIWPIPVHFEKGMAVAIVYMDTSPGSSGRAMVSNIEMRTASGKAIWMIEPTSGGSKRVIPPPPPATPSAPKSGG